MKKLHTRLLETKDKQEKADLRQLIMEKVEKIEKLLHKNKQKQGDKEEISQKEAGDYTESELQRLGKLAEYKVAITNAVLEKMKIRPPLTQPPQSCATRVPHHHVESSQTRAEAIHTHTSQTGTTPLHRTL